MDQHLRRVQTYIYTFSIYMKNSFPKRVKRHSENEIAIPMPSSKIVFLVKIFSYTYICTYLCRTLFKNMTSELGICNATSIFGLALNAFWKRIFDTHIYIYISIYIHIFTWVHRYICFTLIQSSILSLTVVFF